MLEKSTMTKLLAPLLFLIAACAVRHPSTSNATTAYSSQVKDSFTIQLLEHIINDSTPLHSVYVLDAEIDHRTQQLFDSLTFKNPNQNCRVIGIGQTHFSKALRQRDFVPPKSAHFFLDNAIYVGHADSFYSFISETIIPQYDSNSNHRILVGHSFGGLFSTYVSTLSQDKFNRCIAISASLWVNNFGFINHYANGNNRITTRLEIHYGTLEQLNKVAAGAKRFNLLLRQEDQKTVSFHPMKRATHKSILHRLPEILVN
jgi:predicted alpha/beta superfamily hydrolase